MQNIQPKRLKRIFRAPEKQINKAIKGLSERGLECLMNYSWPGNIRELESVIYEAMVLSEKALY